MDRPAAATSSWNAVADALAAARQRALNGETQRTQRLTVVAFLDSWAPPSQATAAALEACRGDVQAYAQLCLVDALAERDAAWDAGVVSTPSLQFFWDGELSQVRRPTWEDDTKLTGAPPAERLVEILRHARDCCAKCAAEHAQLVIGLDF